MATGDNKLYTTVPGSLRRLLGEIPKLGTPSKVDAKWLGSIGFGGGNNQSMLRVLKNVGLIGSDGTPTEAWNAFRGGDKAAFAQAVRNGYSNLFGIYPDAHQKDQEALTAYFRSNTNLGDQAQRLCVQTFKALVEFGDFSSEPKPDAASEEKAKSGASGRSRAEVPAAQPRADHGLALTVNIQLQLPPSTDGEVYDKLFEAMARHLGSLVAPE